MALKERFCVRLLLLIPLITISVPIMIATISYCGKPQVSLLTNTSGEKANCPSGTPDLDLDLSKSS